MLYDYISCYSFNLKKNSKYILKYRLSLSKISPFKNPPPKHTIREKLYLPHISKKTTHDFKSVLADRFLSRSAHLDGLKIVFSEVIWRLEKLFQIT